MEVSVVGIVYCHRNKVTGKCYVGQTKHTLEERVSKNPWRSYRHNKKLADDIATYGWDSFESHVLETVEDSLLDERETYWINELSKTTELYNKQMVGTSNSKYTIRQLHNVNEETSMLFCRLYEEENLSATEISKITGYSTKTILRWLRTYGINVKNCGKISSKQKEQSSMVKDFLSKCVCPVCGKLFKRNDVRIKTCSRECSRIYLYRMSDEDKQRVDSEYSLFVSTYNSILSNMALERKEYMAELETICDGVHDSMVKDIQEQVDKRTVHCSKNENTFWRRDDTECKRLLDLIMNSGVNLSCFGFNSKLCEMFPNDLTKKKILYLLRRYRVPHFERSNSNPTNLKL